ncbi:hypothetical protein GGR56DRAFT_661556 [Xylariaceae sp. FL0804]|nr:hypothetical protein GGR56DRAFT_661556 [Xylariaceae sp. FL0804]
MSLGTLPNEMFHNICDHLQSCHPHSLYELSLVNRHCRVRSSWLLYRNIKIKVCSRAQLRSDLSRWTRLLDQNSCWQAVKEVDVQGSLPPVQPGQPDADQAETFLDRNRDYYRQPEIYGETDYGVFTTDEPVLAVEEEAWAPLVAMLEKFSAVADFSFSCPSQFPKNLLDCLHARHRGCRLHLKQFRLRSLGDERIHPLEWAIVTSPCLYSVCLRYVCLDSAAKSDHNLEALHKMIGGISPNLKRVRATRCRPASSPALARHYRQNIPRRLWVGFPEDVTPRRAALENLSLNTLVSSPFERFQDWSACVDFSSLHTLHLCFEPTAEILGWLSDRCILPRLCNLQIHLIPLQGSTEALAALLRFLRGLLPLQWLRMTGPLTDELMDLVLQRHGATLHTLSTPGGYSFSAAAVDRLRECCPLLEDLSLTVKRRLGRSPESSVYRSLRQLPRLRNLCLDLCCSLDPAEPDFSEDQESSDDFLRQYFPSQSFGTHDRLRFGHVRQTYINTAVDAKLARAIWCAVASGKPGVPLSTLKLMPSGGSISSQDDVAKTLGRFWLVSAPVRDDSQEAVVRELGKAGREQRERPQLLRGGQGDIFRHIWPLEEGADPWGWREQWQSWPLVFDEDA